MRKFRIKLGAIHEETGLTAYAVAKATGLVENTVRKYVSQDVVEMDYVHYSVSVLADFYGVDWRDIVEEVDFDPGETDSPESETALLAVG